MFLKTTSPGIPDLVILPKNQMAIWAEIKRPGGRLSPDQIKFKEDCAFMGHPCFTVYSVDDIKQILEDVGIKL